MPAPLQESDLIFSSAASSLNSTLTELKRSNLTIINRLRSITQDADFVQKVAKAYRLPLIANERCGSWYIPPVEKAGSAYFKSTDGHFGQWAFSLRRLNLQVLDVVAEHGGCIIVDSTRRGKSMPDALSKTVPIWIAVLNRFLFPERTDLSDLQIPSDVISWSEHSQIEERIPGFVEDLRRLNMSANALQSRLVKPMRPVWVTPDSDFDSIPPGIDAAYHTIVLCTASSRSSQAIHHASGYVQGAADDAESWAHGLSPPIFWAHCDELLSTTEEDLPPLIDALVGEASIGSQVRAPAPVKPTSMVWIANNAAAEKFYAVFDVVISCDEVAQPAISEALKDHYLHLACTSGKNGSRQLRSQLPKTEALTEHVNPDARVLMTCPTGKDLAVGVALAILCRHFDSSGSLLCDSSSAFVVPVSKTLIKQRLSWIMVSMPDAAPSRATLQSVNAFLMG